MARNVVYDVVYPFASTSTRTRTRTTRPTCLGSCALHKTTLSRPRESLRYDYISNKVPGSFHPKGHLSVAPSAYLYLNNRESNHENVFFWICFTAHQLSAFSVSPWHVHIVHVCCDPLPIYCRCM